MNLNNENVLTCDAIIVGAGIMGLAIAHSLQELNPTLKIVIIDKENQIGLHASGRNSGVLHAGFYYSPESLKAQFCRDGNHAMKKLAEKHKVDIKHVGKVVVAQNDDELSRMHALFERGVANGVELEIIEERELSKYEPLARTYKEFLWSPTTSIVNKDGVLNALYSELKTNGVHFLFNQKFIDSDHGTISTRDYNIRYKHLINASGGGAISIAHKMGFGLNYEMIPFLGVYRATKLENLPMRRLVYPVPHPVNPFLGTHFTITTDGLVKIGPTAQPVMFSEQYELMDGWNLHELVSSPRAMGSYFRNNFSNVFSLVRAEFPQLFESGLVRESLKLVPSAKNVDIWERKPSGVRAQLLRNDTKALEQDFVVEGDSGSTHLLNIVSPGWTSSIPFAEWVVKEYVSEHL